MVLGCKVLLNQELRIQIHCMTIFGLLSAIVILMCSYSSNVYSAENVPSDQIRTISASSSLKDGCQGYIPSGGNAKYDCEIQNTPPIMSEFCAYENVGDTLDIIFRTYGILNQAAEEKQKTIPYFVVHDIEANQTVYQQRVSGTYVHWSDPAYVDSQEDVNWNLTNNAGAPINVGEKGKEYKVNIYLKKTATSSLTDDNVFYKSKTLDVFVDDCVKRQQAVRDMAAEMSATADIGFLWYLNLEDGVATEICEYIKRGVVDYKVSTFDFNNDTFSQRCHIQCINNSFANELLVVGREPLSQFGDVFARAHYKALRRRQLNRSPNNIGLFANPSSSATNDIVVTMKNLMLYVEAEDYLRARGYKKCSGGINVIDKDLAVKIIQRQFDNVILGGYGLSNFLWVGNFINELLIRGHFNTTDEIYQKIITGN